MKFVNQKYSNKTEINNNKKYIFVQVQPKLQLPFDELDLVSLDPAIQLLVLEWQNVKESQSQKTTIVPSKERATSGANQVGHYFHCKT